MLIKGLINTSVILLSVGAGVAPAVAANPDEQNRFAPRDHQEAANAGPIQGKGAGCLAGCRARALQH